MKGPFLRTGASIAMRPVAHSRPARSRRAALLAADPILSQVIGNGRLGRERIRSFRARNKAAHAMLRLASGKQDSVATGGAAEPDVRAQPNNSPVCAAAWMPLSQLDDVADAEINRHTASTGDHP